MQGGIDVMTIKTEQAKGVDVVTVSEKNWVVETGMTLTRTDHVDVGVTGGLTLTLEGGAGASLMTEVEEDFSEVEVGLTGEVEAEIAAATVAAAAEVQVASAEVQADDAVAVAAPAAVEALEDVAAGGEADATTVAAAVVAAAGVEGVESAGAAPVEARIGEALVCDKVATEAQDGDAV
jgi:hypothetical protein